MKKIFYILIIFSFTGYNSLFSTENLKSTENQADYLVIYHPEFKETIKGFVEWRRLKGVNVLPIDVNEIYDEFGDTISNVDAIRDFLSYSLEFWKEPKPRYLLLVGGINHIPSKKAILMTFENDSISIDDYFVIRKDDTIKSTNKHSIALGRFPARNVNDLKIMLDKTIMFEYLSNEIDYKYDFLISADRKDYQLFEKFANELIDTTLPKYLSIKRFDYREDSKYFGSKEDFINDIKDGSIFLINFFHGTEDVWMFNSLLNSNDVDSLTLTTKPFLIATISCSQKWDNTFKKGIIEEFLCKSRSGAAATLASNGVAWDGTGYRLINKILEEIFLNRIKEFGIAVLKAKKEYHEDLIKRYTYLGDPMLRLPDRLFEPNAISEYFKNVNLSNFPNPCHEYTNIMFSVEDDTNVELDIFDILGNKIENLFSGFSPATVQNIRWDTSNLNSGIYFCRLKSGKNVFSKTISVSR